MRFFLNVFLFIPNLIFAFEFNVTNTFDAWHGTWLGFFKKDSGGINENELSLRVFNSRIQGGLNILYTTYWEPNFSLKDTTTTQITWKYISLETPKVYGTLGSFCYTMGEGLILGMERDETLNRDRQIEGINVGMKLEWFEISQIWGTPIEIDRINKAYRIVNDTLDVLFGLNLSTPIMSRYGILLGSRILRLKKDTLYTNLWGGNFEFSSNHISWYIEVAQRSGKEKGWGVYSNLDIFLGSYNFNLQFINYDTLRIGGMTYKYNLLPTLNQSGYSINEGQDEIGFQITMKKTIGDKIFSISHSKIIPKFLAKENKKEIKEYSLEANFFDFYTSFSFSSFEGHIVSPFKKQKKIKGEIDGSIKDIEFLFSIQKIDGITWRDVKIFDISGGFRGPVFNIFTIYSNYTRRSKEIVEESPGIEWWGIGVKVNYSSNLFFDFWKGKEKGGVVCSGGVCSYVAPFEGFKAKLTIIL